MPQSSVPELHKTRISGVAGSPGRAATQIRVLGQMQHQSFYRRYRPQRFCEIKGQDHMVGPLQAAVRSERVGHAYLFHGPRGTGKTSTARVLAKALNCEHLNDDAEPCCACGSCVSISDGVSFDLQEIDAASHNKVEDMRALLERVNLASPGKSKVYLLDEVHMLTPGAENALLKTLEEPPSHVIWVLATTEPGKVAETVRSRCQVFELRLLGDEAIAEHVRGVLSDAGIEIDEAAVEYAVSSAGGSLRDALSALDSVSSGGDVPDGGSCADALLDALAARDTAAALAVVGDAAGRGQGPRTLGEQTIAGLRGVFLTIMGRPPERISDHQRSRCETLAEQMPAAAVTAALEALGRCLVSMRQAPDPRVDLEIALLELCSSHTQTAEPTMASLVERIERLEGQVEQLNAGAAASGSGDAAAAPSTRPPPDVPPPVPSTLPPSDVPPPVPARGPAQITPLNAEELVQLADRHLGVTREEVVASANEVLGPKQGQRRSPQEVKTLWEHLISRQNNTASEAPSSVSREHSTDVPVPAAPPKPPQALPVERQDSAPSQDSEPDAFSSAATEPAVEDPEDQAPTQTGAPAGTQELLGGIEQRIESVFPGSDVTAAVP